VNVHKNAKLTPAGREQLVKRVLFEKQAVKEVSRGMGVSSRFLLTVLAPRQLRSVPDIRR